MLPPGRAPDKAMARRDGLLAMSVMYHVMGRVRHLAELAGGDDEMERLLKHVERRITGIEAKQTGKVKKKTG